jgi:hypothetical protein
MELTPDAVPVGPVDWRPSYRIIPSRFPPISLFERVADPADLEDVLALESLTNPRLREEAGEIAMVPPEDRIAGPGTAYVMAAFTHVRPEGGRFHDGTFGAYYAAAERPTAIAETDLSVASRRWRANDRRMSRNAACGDVRRAVRKCRSS